jgi:hypothetical protein
MRIEAIYKNGMDSIAQEASTIKSICTYMMPCIIGATLFKGLAEQALLAQPASVVSYAATTLTGGQYLLMALAGISLVKIADPHFTALGYKKIEKVTITKEEFEVMKKEIDRLTTENADLTRRLG